MSLVAQVQQPIQEVVAAFFIHYSPTYTHLLLAASNNRQSLARIFYKISGLGKAFFVGMKVALVLANVNA